jgi:hypothetical protein
MNGFEFLFSFYSLLLGLAVANVATGFADMWRSRRETAIGTLGALLGLLILFSAAQQWMSCWGARDALTMGPWQILAIIAIALPFVFISRAMFPRDEDEWSSWDDYYIAHRRVLLTILLIPPVVSIWYNFAHGNVPDAWGALYRALQLGVPVLLILCPTRVVHRIGLAAMTINIVARLFA